MLFEAECLQYGVGVAGTEGRDTLIRLQENLEHVFFVGISELIVAFFGLLADAFVIKEKPPPKHVVAVSLLLAFLDAVLSTYDFFFATRTSAAEAEKLLAHLGDGEWWCALASNYTCSP